MDPVAAPQPTSKSALAVTALVLAIVGVFCFPIGIVAVILGIIAVVTLPTGHAKKGLAIAAIVVPVVSVPVTGILAAIAIPNFIKYKERSTQVECRSNLRALYAAERAFFEESQRYTEDFDEIHWAPEARRYAYFLGPRSRVAPTMAGANVPAAAPAAAGGVHVGLDGLCPKCSIVAMCVGEVSGGPDVWSISTQDRTSENGEPIAAGEVFHDQAEHAR